MVTKLTETLLNQFMAEGQSKQEKYQKSANKIINWPLKILNRNKKNKANRFYDNLQKKLY